MWPDLHRDFARAVLAAVAPMPAGIIGDAVRFDVYRNTVATSRRRALADIYPVVGALVGGEFFNAMADAYTEITLPSTPVLADYGRDFADFIGGFAPAASVPYLPDVARLERLWLDVYHAADASPLAVDALAAVAPDLVDGLRLELHPSVAVLVSDWPAASIWQAHQGTDTPDLSVVEFKPETALLVRPNMDVRVRALTPVTATLVRGLQAGHPLGRALESVDGDVSSALAELFAVGAISGFIMDHENKGTEQC